MKTLSIFLIFCFCSIGLSAQQYLYITKKGSTPAERLGINSKVKIKIEGESEWIEGSLKRIDANAIKINDRLFYFSNIEAIRTYNHLVKVIGSAIWGGGVFFTSIAFVNRLINDDDPLIRPSQVTFGAGMIGAGALISWASRKTYSKAKGYSFKVIDLDQKLGE